MKDERVKIILPKDPYQIGVTPKGEVVWVDPKDFIPTPDEKLEQKANMLAGRHAANVDKMAVVVIQNALQFVQETVVNVVPKEGLQLSDESTVSEWFLKCGFDAIQDGLTTVVKVKGKVLRTMTASVDVRFRQDVSRRVMQTFQQNAFSA